MNATGEEIDEAPPDAEVDDPAAEAVEQRQAEAEAEAEQRTLTPFYTVDAAGFGAVTVRAGWLNGSGEVESLAINNTVPRALQSDATATARQWHEHQLNRISRARFAAAEQAEEEADDD